MIGAILLAAGAGSRMSGENKMLRNIGNSSVLCRSLRTLLSVHEIEKIVVVVSDATRDAAQELICAFGAGSRCSLTAGGRERSDSVYAGLKALEGADIVAVHDGARCLVTPQVIRRTIESAQRTGSGVAMMPAKDTVKRVRASAVVETLDRSELYIVQTPQTFRYDILRRAYDDAMATGAKATDDASFVERMGITVTVVEGAYDNVKITTEDDLFVAEAILLRQEQKPESAAAVDQRGRVGFGEDTHRLVEGRALVLGGVRIPYEKGLLGHSDADVLTHAVMDALLGAAALGDIGKHFPDTDEGYRGADSVGLLREVREKLAAAGFAAGNIDATVIAQKPRLAPYIDAMRKAIADAVGIPVDRVGIKATTSEGLGFEGRGEGITARCVARIAPL